MHTFRPHIGGTNRRRGCVEGAFPNSFDHPFRLLRLGDKQEPSPKPIKEGNNEHGLPFET